MKTLVEFINEQRIDELSSDLLTRAAITAKNRNGGKMNGQAQRFEKAAKEALSREIRQAQVDTNDLKPSNGNQKYELYKKKVNCGAFEP